MHCEAREWFSRPVRSGICAVHSVVTDSLYGRDVCNISVYLNKDTRSIWRISEVEVNWSLYILQ